MGSRSRRTEGRRLQYQRALEEQTRLQQSCKHHHIKRLQPGWSVCLSCFCPIQHATITPLAADVDLGAEVEVRG